MEVFSEINKRTGSNKCTGTKFFESSINIQGLINLQEGKILKNSEKFSNIQKILGKFRKNSEKFGKIQKKLEKFRKFRKNSEIFGKKIAEKEKLC